MAEIKAKELLEKEIESEISNLAHMQPGQEDHTEAVDNLTKLYKLKLEEDKLKEESKDRYFKFGADMAKVVMQLGFFGIWMQKGFRFEETGSITSSTFRNLIGNFKLPKL